MAAAFGNRQVMNLPADHPFTQVQGGSYRVNNPAQAAAGASPFAQPPIPAGSYNPIRDIELNAGKTGEQNTINALLTKGTRGNQSYQLGTEAIQHREGEQEAANTEAVQALQRSYQRLGVRQTEQAREAGELHGGAVLQSAQKRAANEGIQSAAQARAYAAQRYADQQDLGSLTRSHQQELEDNATGIGQAEQAQTQFGIDTNTLKGTEAAEHGYLSPTGPSNALTQSAFNKVNPANGEHYREYQSGGQTIHEYHSGRKVTV